MIILRPRTFITLPVIVFLALLFASPLNAEPAGPGWGPGMMMGPGMWGWGMTDRNLCDPRAAGLATWRIQAIERAVGPIDAQRLALDALKAASTQAAESIAAACPREFPQSPIGRLGVMEKRLAAMLEAVRTVRPAFESFYSSLSDEQKARFNTVGSRRGSWRGWHWAWSRG